MFIHMCWSSVLLFVVDVLSSSFFIVSFFGCCGFFFFGHTSGKGQEECPQERVCVCACVRDVSVASFFG